jgi:hypothetical protein
MHHLALERHRAAKRGAGLRRQLLFETGLKREVAGADNKVAHGMISGLTLEGLRELNEA